MVAGWVRLAYARGVSSDPAAPSGAKFKTTETDPNGNVRVHYFGERGHELRTMEHTNRNVRPTEGDYVTSYAYTNEGLLASRMLPRGT